MTSQKKMTKSLSALERADNVIDLSFDAQELHIVIGSPFENRHIVALGLFAEKACVAHGIA